MPEKKRKTSARMRILWNTTSKESTGELYGHPVSEFKSNRMVDNRLSKIEWRRYEAWLNLRAALRGRIATAKDRSKALEKWVDILRGMLPATFNLVRKKPDW